jgi:hypothetical protein
MCDNKSAITATWKEENISVFEKAKPDADVAKVAQNAIADLQPFSAVKCFWVEGHADKHGPPFSPEEELNILTDGLATIAQKALPPDMRPRPDCLHFFAQQISIVIRHSKVTSHLPYDISNAIHGHQLTKYLTDKERWPILVYNSIAWDSLKISFNKLTRARQIVTYKQCSASGAPTFTKYATVVNSSNATSVVTKTKTGVMSPLVKALLIFRAGSWAQLRTKINKWKIHSDIWRCFDHGLQHFYHHPLSTDIS